MKIIHQESSYVCGATEIGLYFPVYL